MNFKLGDIGPKMQFENNLVRLWDLVLAPGQSSSWHQHTNEYLFTVTRSGILLVECQDGSEQEKEYVLGQVVMGQKNSIHRVTNIGRDLYSNSIVELIE